MQVAQTNWRSVGLGVAVLLGAAAQSYGVVEVVTVIVNYEGLREIRADGEDVFNLVAIPLLTLVACLVEVGVLVAGFRFTRGAMRFAFGVAGAVSLGVTLCMALLALVLFSKFE